MYRHKNTYYNTHIKMMSSKMIVLVFCMFSMAINFVVYGNEITYYEHVLNYIKVGLMVSYMTLNSWKIGEIYIKGLEFELLSISSMVCMEKVYYYNNGMDLDFAHYGKFVIFYAYWYYKVDERAVKDFLSNIDQTMTVMSIKLRCYINQ